WTRRRTAMMNRLGRLMGVTLAVVCWAALPAHAAEKSKDIGAAIAAIDAMTESLTKTPNQFTLNVTCVGVHAQSHGGTGLNIENKGNGVGMIASANCDQAKIETIKGEADAAIRKESEKAIAMLTDLKGLLQAPKIDKPKVRTWWDTFKDTV